MGPTVEQIEGHIDRTRDQLASNLDEFERRFEAATDWHEHFRARPLVFLGAAVAGGALAAIVFGHARSNGTYRSQNRPAGEAISGSALAARPHSPVAQAGQIWNNIKHAAVSLAATRLKDYIDSFLDSTSTINGLNGARGVHRVLRRGSLVVSRLSVNE